VWTETDAEAARISALCDEDFHAELERRFGLHLGDIALAGPRRAYPLGLFIARSFVAERIALVGDAAHVIHPIAGQGLNMGLRDVAALAEAIVDAARLGLDIGGADVLDRYQRWRRFDTMAMGVATDGLNRLFSNRSDVLRLARDIGLGVVERLPMVKDFFIREAAGITGDVPKLLKGEALYTVNTLVDALNLCSLRAQLPFGLYDLDRVEPPIVLRRGTPGESYEGIRKAAVHVEGRPVLVDARGPFGNPTSDSARTMITTACRRALVIVYAPGRFPPARLQSVLDETTATLTRWSGGSECARQVLP